MYHGLTLTNLINDPYNIVGDDNQRSQAANQTVEITQEKNKDIFPSSKAFSAVLCSFLSAELLYSPAITALGAIIVVLIKLWLVNTT